uniref:Variant surface glycoprotein 1125.1342 n=1 Tax=Trypanosoma brucei TaxID=5691 RepID=M4SWD8_9TRYP|nr:variant surface glycoprotein 1428 [Trypanosoma brucei]APD73565.1 variant surface glycoprotein 1125.1342 [Trypanosoma brucei]
MHLLFLLLTLTLAHSVRAAQGYHVADFLPLCEARQVAKALAATSYTVPNIPSDMQDILNFNMSIATASWKAIFTDQGPQNTWDKFKAEHGTELGTSDWSDRWDYLKSAGHQTAKAESKWNSVNQKLINKETVNDTRSYIEALANNAFDVFKMTQDELKDADGKTITSLKAVALTAMCSEPLAAQPDTTDCKDIAAAPRKDATCYSAGAHKAGSSIALDMVCLCSTQTNSVCTADTEARAAIMANDNLGNGVLAQLLAACPKTPTKLDPSTEEATAIAMLASRLGHGTTRTAEQAIYLGIKGGKECSASAGSCLDYSAYFKSTNQGLRSVPWVSNLLKAADYYKTILARRAADQAAADKISQMKKELLKKFKRPNPKTDAIQTTDRERKQEKQRSNKLSRKIVQ